MGLWSWLRGLFGGGDEPAPRQQKKKKNKKDGEDKPLISLVLLLRSERYVDEAILTRLVNEAWDVQLGTGDPQATDFVVGASPSFVVQCQGRHFLVNNFGRPYLDDPEAAAADIKELRLRKAFLGHQAWLSVDLLGDCPDPKELAETYRMIGRLVAGLLDDDCLALYAPAMDQMLPYSETLEERLKGPDVLDIFARPDQVPVVGVEGDDPRMQAAVAEAHEHWPEFVAAFEERAHGQGFAVKAKFTEGDEVEFMWLAVEALENDVIFGRLDNDPVSIKRLRLGSKVRVPLADLNDWIVVNGEDMQGGFTIKAIQEIQNDSQLGKE